MIGTVLGFLGLSPLRAIAYGAIVAAVLVAGLTIRQHYINLGWNKAITAVKKQDERAKDAAEQVERKANECSENSYWDVISASCKADAP